MPDYIPLAKESHIAENGVGTWIQGVKNGGLMQSASHTCLPDVT
jgi:hypothetical protein